MKPVSLWESCNIFKQSRISTSSIDVNARTMILIGQIIPCPVRELPRPAIKDERERGRPMEHTDLEEHLLWKTTNGSNWEETFEYSDRSNGWEEFHSDIDREEREEKEWLDHPWLSDCRFHRSHRQRSTHYFMPIKDHRCVVGVHSLGEENRLESRRCAPRNLTSTTKLWEVRGTVLTSDERRIEKE